MCALGFRHEAILPAVSSARNTVTAWGAKLSESFDEQINDQKVQVENLKTALRNLEGKLGEARGKSDLLLARHRRTRAASTPTKLPRHFFTLPAMISR